MQFEIIECCVSLLSIWLINRCDEEVEGFQAPRVVYGRGRPRAMISQNQLQYLRSMNFSWGHTCIYCQAARRFTRYPIQEEDGARDSRFGCSEGNGRR